jgi:1,2-dihydroxy-3-keto-5-methylthiopentene dioxygenase
MACLTLENGSVLTDENEINAFLAKLGVTLKKWDLNFSKTQDLLTKPSLSDEQKSTLLVSYDHYFEELKMNLGYQDRDLIVLNPQTPNLEDLTNKFIKPHTHDDDEVRFIVDGEGIFGFESDDGKVQAELLMEAGEFINVPKMTKHWFYLTSKKRIKAVRYFSNREGWTPRYLDLKVRLESQAALS